MTDALQYIESTAMLGSRLGLARVEELLQKLGSPEKKLKFVHVAGTNGKGSTSAMLASVLEKSGYRTGLYISPHLLRYHERFCINGQAVSDDGLTAATRRVKAAADTLADAPTQFELLTCIAFCIFEAENCDIVVLEVGLGGRLDATNVIPVPEVAVITRIGLEHTEILGDTVEKIAAEKAGIVKPGGTVVLGDQTNAVRGVVADICRRTGAQLKMTDLSEVEFHSSSLQGQRFGWRQYPEIALSLLGSHQLQNASTALETILQLRQKGWNIPDAALLEGLKHTVWPGRFECVSTCPAIVIDGGHNRQCAEAIAAALRDYFPGKQVIFLIGVLADKDFSGIFDALLPLAKQVAAVTPDSPRALEAQTLCQRLKTDYHFANATPCSSVAEALALVRQSAQKGDVICACGSLYLIGEVRAQLHLT